LTGVNNGLAEGSLAMDGDRASIANADVKIWHLDTLEGIFANGFDG
jgi:hypothetical protein